MMLNLMMRVIEWRSITHQPRIMAQPAARPQTPPPVQEKDQPPVLERKQSFKTVQQLAEQHADQQDAAAQPKLQRLKKQLHIDMAFLSIAEYAYVITAEQDIPCSYNEVMNSPQRDEWLKAVEKEHSALQQMGCFGQQQELPEGYKATNTNFIFVIKSDGQKKARLVFKNNPFTYYGQQDNYSPVVDRTVIRAFLHEALRRGWNIEKADINNAYINADMDEEVYVKTTQRFFPGGWKGQKAIESALWTPKGWKAMV
jgi:hypothetical protein